MSNNSINQRGTLQSIFKLYSVTFLNNHAMVDRNTPVPVARKKNINKSQETLLNEIDVASDRYLPTLPQFEIKRGNIRDRILGKTHYHTEYVCCQLTQLNNYKYVMVSANYTPATFHSLKKITLYLNVACVASAIWIIILLCVITFDMDFYTSIPFLGAVAIYYVIAMSTVTKKIASDSVHQH